MSLDLVMFVRSSGHKKNNLIHRRTRIKKIAVKKIVSSLISLLPQITATYSFINRGVKLCQLVLYTVMTELRFSLKPKEKKTNQQKIMKGKRGGIRLNNYKITALNFTIQCYPRFRIGRKAFFQLLRE